MGGVESIAACKVLACRCQAAVAAGASAPPQKSWSPSQEPTGRGASGCPFEASAHPQEAATFEPPTAARSARLKGRPALGGHGPWGALAERKRRGEFPMGERKRRAAPLKVKR